MLKITIPTPCHEDWNKMTPDETGRHCSSCAKSVVDFTGMSDDEVKHFFLNKKEDERVCGRFKQTQLHRNIIELPQNIFSIQMPLWKKFLAACLIVFSTTLFSCETNVKGKAIAATEINNNINLVSNDHNVGGMVVIFDTIAPPVCTVGNLIPPMIVRDPVIELQGDIAFIDTVPVKQTDTIPANIEKGEVQLKDTTYTSFKNEPLIMGLPVKPVKTKNPPKADSINCNTIKNYY